jgi:hypothetical protein
VKQITGTLSSEGGEELRVGLAIDTVELPGEHGADDEAISEVRLATGGIPDGDYMLEYFCFRPHRESVRVKYGVLVSR